MASQNGFSRNRAPSLDAKNYAFWSIRMRTYIMAFGFDIWQSDVIGYTTPTTPPTYVVKKKLNEHNTKYMNVILCGLSKWQG
jgi:hypothetical protein